MNAIQSIGLSALAAAQVRLAGAAHNIANAQTAGFHRQRVDATALPEGGVAVCYAREAAPGENLAADLVAQRQAVVDFKAGLRTLQAADTMMGSLLDVLA